MLYGKNSEERKPMVLKGARQVGKTWLMKEFGETCYENYVYFNFDEDEELKSIFESNKNPHRITELLSMIAEEKIMPGETLIIFDEIQECPEALNTLKYFKEKANEYHVIAAGSLLDYFGEGMRESWRKGAEEQRHIQKWLADNCFGDYYTRGGLTDKEREMVTFCYLLAQGGCEPQLTAHAMGNMGLGNDKNFLIDVVSQCVPYIGYPRSLNALTCINNAAEKLSK